MNDNVDLPNFSTMRYDDLHPYITDVKTLKRLYKLPACRICDIRTWLFNSNAECGHCQPSRMQGNDE